MKKNPNMRVSTEFWVEVNRMNGLLGIGSKLATTRMMAQIVRNSNYDIIGTMKDSKKTKGMI